MFLKFHIKVKVNAANKQNGNDYTVIIIISNKVSHTKGR